MSRAPVLPLVLALTIAPTGCTSPGGDTGRSGYGPDCVESYEPPALCACEVEVDWSAVDPARLDVAVLAEPASVAATETCSGGVSPSSVVESWEIGVLDVGDGARTFDLRPHLGRSFTVVAADRDGRVIRWVAADVADGGGAAVTLD